MAALSHVPVGALDLERFGSVLPPEDYERILRTVRRGREVFDGRVVWNVNSTAVCASSAWPRSCART
jgi:hypothetical protein